MEYVVITLMPKDINPAAFGPFETWNEGEDFLKQRIDAYAGTRGVVWAFDPTVSRAVGLRKTKEPGTDGPYITSKEKESIKCGQAQAAWPMCVGAVVTYLGLGLMALGSLYSLELWLRWLICLLGFNLFAAGFFLLWKHLLSAPDAPVKPIPEQPDQEGVYLGSFDLNGYSFKAYERETANGNRQFRLVSFPPLTPEREAAFIRYIVNEGLIENIWRETSKKIEEEANWAFLK